MKNSKSVEINEKKFFDDVFFIPRWVQTVDDLKVFVAHIQFRLVQREEECKLIYKKFRESKKFDDFYWEEVVPMRKQYDNLMNSKNSHEEVSKREKEKNEKTA